MKPFRSSSSLWRTLLIDYSARPIMSNRSTFATSRNLSELAATSRLQLRNRVALTQLASKRWNSSTTAQGQISSSDQKRGSLVSDPESSPSSATSETEPPAREEPSYEITFTCKPCQTRSTHKISKQGYHKGTILVTCPECKNRHLICDHLKIFKDQSTTIEDILKEKGELIKRGSVGAGGDIEIWDDGTTTDRSAAGTTSKLAEQTGIQPPVP